MEIQERSWRSQMDNCNKWIADNNQNITQIRQTSNSLKQLLQQQRIQLLKDCKTWDQEKTCDFDICRINCFNTKL